MPSQSGGHADETKKTDGAGHKTRSEAAVCASVVSEKEKEKSGKKISLWSKRKEANEVCQGKTKKEENIFQTQTSIQERKKL